MTKKTITFKGGIIDLNKRVDGTEYIVIDITEGYNPKYDEIVLDSFLIQDWRQDDINGKRLARSSNKQYRNI